MARVVVAGVIVTYALAVLQATLGGQMAIHGVAPDLLFLWTICVGLLSGGPAGALVGFAGPNVIKQTIHGELPKGFQRSEFLLEKGFLDMIVNRAELRPTVSKLLCFCDPR